MTSTLAIYEALIQANVPPLAARRAAEALEADMTTHLATKQDVAHLGELLSVRIDGLEARFDRIDERFDRIDERFARSEHATDARFAMAESRYDLKLQTLESRIVVKLGGLMTFLFGLSGAAVALLG
jgi:hypothetical protein